MASGGIYRGGSSSYSEILNLCPGNLPDLDCLRPARLPVATYGGVSLKTPAGIPLFCGGFDNEGQCYEYSIEENDWVIGKIALFLFAH